MLDDDATGGGTVGKALSVLDQIAALGRPVRFTELLEESRFPKATLYRLLRTLTQQSMLDYDERSQAYSLGPRLVRLANAAWRNFSLAPLARPVLDRLSAEIGATVHLARLDGGQVLYIDKRNPARPITMFSSAGKVGPAYCTGVGKAMLAFLGPALLERALGQQAFHRHTDRTFTSRETLMAELKAIRARGHAFDDEEHEPAIICVAAPIIGGDGAVIGGLSITSSTNITTLDALAQNAGALKTAAAEIAGEADARRLPNGADEQL